MNRIVLVGNGFDLAHGLHTGYEHFMEWYWRRWGEALSVSGLKRETDGLCSFDLNPHLGYASWAEVRRDNLSMSAFEWIEMAKRNASLCTFSQHSQFLGEICKSIESKGWVDVENEYYRLLNAQFSSPENLNDDFEIVKNKLVEYLDEIQYSKIVEMPILDEVGWKLISPIHEREISVKNRRQWIDFARSGHSFSYYDSWGEKVWQQGSFRDGVEALEKVKQKGQGAVPFAGLKSSGDDLPEQIFPDRIMLLNFNYTSTADRYFHGRDENYFLVNHIHGELSNRNGIIFGHGDEMDDNYSSLKKINDNELFKNMKTIRYSENSNYRKMLSFIESAPYQICIMGHSCGNSDRTLLNTLFEHENCVSIKLFYRKMENGSDNYLKIIQNISRSFTDMKLMRDRVVNKMFCEPLLNF